jgi:NifB/MoaA-like Fe-S oxidoreductase
VAHRAEHGASIVHLADEWYLLAGLEVPPAGWYDDYPQLENGIGLVRQLLEDSSRLQAGRRWERPGKRFRSRVSHSTMVCGTLIAPLLVRLAGGLAERSGCRIDVVPVANRLFGESVTVSGLLAGEDVLGALEERDALGDIVFLPRAMFARPPGGCDELLTLDGLSVDDFRQRLGRPVALAEWVSEVWDQIVVSR